MQPVPSVVLEIESRMEYASAAESAAFGFASALGLIGDDARDYSLSVRELAINGIKHGNKLNPERRVRIEFYDTRDIIRTCVEDEGEQRFDPENYFTATGENALSNHGRGLIFVESYTPGWRYDWLAPGNRFTVEKPIPDREGIF